MHTESYKNSFQKINLVYTPLLVIYYNKYIPQLIIFIFKLMISIIE